MSLKSRHVWQTACLVAGTFAAIAASATAAPRSVPPSPAPVAPASVVKTPEAPADATPPLAPCIRTATTYDGHAAFRLTDGKTEVVIVPSIGRVMYYGLVGGENQLWNAPLTAPTNGGWYNHGGDKTWAAPQDNWIVLTGRSWPPYDNWDGAPHDVTLLPQGALRTTTQVSPTSGVRCIREYGFDAQGGFVISQIFEKVSGTPVTMSIWSVTQVPSPAAVYLRRTPDSPYTSGYFGFRSGGKAPVLDIAPVGTDLLRLRPSTTSQTKIGIDSPVSGIIALRAGVAFVERAAKPDGNYPDGASGAGFPVEIYSNPQPAYTELELLSPLQIYRTGTRVRHTVTWHLYKLPIADVNALATLEFAAAQLQEQLSITGK